ncbi:MAG TPA: hypothetical protein VMG39_10085 [Pseudolabrys sp.]|nr:hypothetical protein [Pseudolabrys sp.]
MKKLFAAMLALTALTGPGFAQSDKKTPLQVEQEEKKKAAAQAEKDYQAAMKKTQDQTTPQVAVDPWANMRQVDGAQPKR